jgi:hypothetical protein
VLLSIFYIPEHNLGLQNHLLITTLERHEREKETRNLTGKKIHENDMRGVVLLLIRTDISKGKPVKSGIIVMVHADAGNRKKNDPPLVVQSTPMTSRSWTYIWYEEDLLQD